MNEELKYFLWNNSIKTISNLPVTIISTTANIEGIYDVVALIKLPDGTDFIEWYSLNSYDSINKVLPTDGSKHNLNLQNFKGE